MIAIFAYDTCVFTYLATMVWCLNEKTVKNLWQESDVFFEKQYMLLKMLFSSFVTLNWSCSSACDKPFKLSHPCYLLVHTFLLICK